MKTVLPVFTTLALLSVADAALSTNTTRPSTSASNPTSAPAAAPESHVVRLLVQGGTAWSLIIDQDGSGMYGYGSSDFAKFPEQTYSFDETKAALIVASGGRGPSRYYVSFIRDDVRSQSMAPVTDASIARKLFEAAFKADAIPEGNKQREL